LSKIGAYEMSFVMTRTLLPVLSSVKRKRNAVLRDNLIPMLKVRNMKADVKAERGARLKQAREAAGYKTAAAFARSMPGIDDYTYRTYEAGTRNISYEQAEKFSRVLNVSVEWLLSGKTEYSGILSAPVRGTIIDGGFIAATHSLTGGTGMKVAEQPLPEDGNAGADGRHSAFFALVVETRQFEPFINHGSVVYYSRLPQNADDCLRSPCIVQIKGGKAVFAVMTRGSSDGLYDIQGHGSDLEIEWCARCEFTKHA
jgi:transcriptional regulator with XRE-family HTH domain